MTFDINQVGTIFIAIMLLFLGTYFIHKFEILKRFAIPAPVIGGLILATILFFTARYDILTINFDTSLQSLFMLMFFTTVGLNASLSFIKTGGKLLLIYWFFASLLSIVQNAFSISLAKLFGLEPLIGLMAGSISMIGGHGGAAAFGETIEGMGVENAMAIGLAAATFGLVAGGIIGGPVARFLIKRNNLDTTPNLDIEPQYQIPEGVESSRQIDPLQNFFIHLALITFVMFAGTLIAETFSETTGVILPNYVGAMFVAVLIRSFLDTKSIRSIFAFDMKLNDNIGTVSLGIFLSMAVMSIQLGQILDLALPILAIVAVQILFIILYSVFFVFYFIGKNYDAAVMISGMVGHGLGATPTAMANMDAVTKQYGPSPTAFLIIPIVGAFLIDVVNIPIVVTFINIFG